MKRMKNRTKVILTAIVVTIFGIIFEGLCNVILNHGTLINTNTLVSAAVCYTTVYLIYYWCGSASGNTKSVTIRIIISFGIFVFSVVIGKILIFAITANDPITYHNRWPHLVKIISYGFMCCIAKKQSERKNTEDFEVPSVTKTAEKVND